LPRSSLHLDQTLTYIRIVKKYRPILLTCLFILVGDVIILDSFIYWERPTPDVAIGELIMVPAVILSNPFVAAVVSFIKFFVNRKRLASVFLINAFVAALIFHGLWSAWYAHYEKQNFIRYVFYEMNNKQCELTLDKRDSTYSFSEINNPGTTTEFKRGGYQQHRNSIILVDSSRSLLIFNGLLFGYPSIKDTIHLLGEK
jgi:hypothetical protein